MAGLLKEVQHMAIGKLMLGGQAGVDDQCGDIDLFRSCQSDMAVAAGQTSRCAGRH